MRVSTSQLHQQTVKAMLDQQSNVGKTQLQLASGRRIQAPSDDPTGAKSVLDLTQVIEVRHQYQRNADAAESRLEHEETVLSNAVNLLQRVRELAVRGNNDTVGAEGRKAIATEVRELLDTLVSLANTKDANGEYIFAGHQSKQEPIVDGGSGTFTYNGDQGQRELQVGPARRIETGDPASDVFMNISGSAKNMFEMLYDMAANMDANSPDLATLDDIDAAMDNILGVRAKIGSRLNAIDGQRGLNESERVQLEQTRSIIQDLDYAEAVTRLNKQLLGLEAAQKSYSRVQGLSLFNFL